MDQITVKRSFNRIGWSFVAFAFIPEILIITVLTIASAVAPALVEQSWFAIALSDVSIWAVAFPIFFLIIKKVPDNPPIQTENRKISVGKMLLLCLVTIGLAQAIAILFNLLSGLVSNLIGVDMTDTTSAALTGGSLWISLLTVVVIAPIFEEIVFRLMLYKKTAGYSGKLYMVISALFFALFHKNLYQLPYCFVVGLIFAYVTYHTGKTIYAIILHFALNAVGGISLIVAATGDETALVIYSIAIFAVIIIGCITALVWYLKKRKELRFEHDESAERPSNKTVYGAFGIWFFIAILAVVSVISVFVAALIQG